MLHKRAAFLGGGFVSPCVSVAAVRVKAHGVLYFNTLCIHLALNWMNLLLVGKEVDLTKVSFSGGFQLAGFNSTEHIKRRKLLAASKQRLVNDVMVQHYSPDPKSFFYQVQAFENHPLQ